MPSNTQNQNRDNHRNNNVNTNNNISIKQDVADKTANLPYTFYPIEKTKRKIVDSAMLNQIYEDRFDGEIHCSLYALNHLCVGNEHITDKKDNKGISFTEIDFLKIGEKPIISAYTIKSCISSFVSAFFDIPMIYVKDERFCFRPNLSFGGRGKIKNGYGIITKSTDESVEIVKLDGQEKYGFSKTPEREIYYKNDRIRIDKLKDYTDNDFAKYNGINNITILKEEDLPVYDRNRNKTYPSFIPFKYQNGIDGFGYLTREFLEKHPNGKQDSTLEHDIVYIPKSNFEKNGNNYKLKNSSSKFTIKKEVIEKFYKTVDTIINSKLNNLKPDEISKIRNTDNIKKLKSLKPGTIIFFEYLDEKKEIVTFGKTCRYLWAYNKSIMDFSEQIGFLDEEFNENEKNNLKKVAINRELFGYMKDENNSKASKVHFNNAVYIKNTGCFYSKEKNFKLPVTGTPKASSYEFYIKQDLNTSSDIPLNTYGDPARVNDKKPALSGRKFYRRTHFSQIKSIEDITGNNNMGYVILKTVLLPKEKKNIENEKNYMPHFKFKIKFENLTNEEIAILLFSLELGDKNKRNSNGTVCHQIGYGKNFGMGAVKIVADDIKIIKFENEEFSSQSIIEKDIYEKIKEIYNNYNVEFKKKDIYKIYQLQGKQFQYPKKDNEVMKWHSNIHFNDFKIRKGFVK